MPALWRDIAGLLGDRFDAELLPALYARVSVPTARIRAELRQQGLPFLDPDTGQHAELPDVLAAALRVARRANRRSAALGAVAGAVGPWAGPPELVASLAHHIRLAQRLAVLYGFDPETDAGKLVMWRAIAAAYELELPAQLRVDFRVSELPAVIQPALPDRSGVASIGRKVAARTFGAAFTSVGRMLPGFGAGFGAWSAGRRTSLAARRMIDVLSRAAEAAPVDLGEEDVAVEVPGF